MYVDGSIKTTDRLLFIWRKERVMGAIKTIVFGIENMDVPKWCSSCRLQMQLFCMTEKHLTLKWNERHSKCPIVLAKMGRGELEAEE